MSTTHAIMVTMVVLWQGPATVTHWMVPFWELLRTASEELPELDHPVSYCSWTQAEGSELLEAEAAAAKLAC